MIVIDINPVAFFIGTVAIRWSAIWIGIGIFTLFFLSLSEAKRVRFPLQHYYGAALWITVGAVVFSRLAYILFRLDYYIAHPDQMLGPESWGIYALILGGIVGMLLYSIYKHTLFWKTADIFALSAIAGMAIGRIGCFINGCCHGIPADLPWSVVYLHPDSLSPLNIPIHPTQLYYVLWDGIAFCILWSLRHKLLVYGSTTLLFVIVYAIGDIAIRFTRAGDAVLFGLQEGQIVSIIGLLVAVPWFIVKVKRTI